MTVRVKFIQPTILRAKKKKKRKNTNTICSGEYHTFQIAVRFARVSQVVVQYRSELGGLWI